MRYFGESVTGMQRKNNEDSIYPENDENEIPNVFIVADGMGGHNAGEVASKMAINKFIEHMKNDAVCINEENLLDNLVEGVIYANSVIFKQSQSKDSLNGMGTTFSCAYIKNNKFYAVHVGDSRIYILSNKKLKQLTTDHSFVMEMVKQGKLTLEEAKVHPKRNIITRAVGTEEKIDVDTIIKNIEENDEILLCSDGLTTMVDDEKIEKILLKNKDVKNAAKKLIAEANKNGGKDNISVIIIKNEVES